MAVKMQLVTAGEDSLLLSIPPPPQVVELPEKMQSVTDGEEEASASVTLVVEGPDDAATGTRSVLPYIIAAVVVAVLVVGLVIVLRARRR